MKREITKRLTIVIAVIMLLILLCNLILQIETTRDTVEQRASMTIERIHSILVLNELDLERLTESLKEEYIVRARAAAYVLANSPETGTNSARMLTLAQYLQVDEICIFDENGTLYGGSHPEYYGYSMHSGDQISYFLPMLSDKSLSLCQSVMPNSFSGEPMMYAAVWSETGDYIVQVGFTPARLREMNELNSVETIFTNLVVQDGFTAVAVDKASGWILGATDPNLLGQRSTASVTALSMDDKNFCYGRVEGAHKSFVYREHGDLMVGVVWDFSLLHEGLGQSMFLVLLYLSVAAVIMIYVILCSMDKLVIGSIRTINHDLSEITGGNLETKVKVETLPEFVDLSSHINLMTESLLNTTVKISRILDATDAQIGFFEYFVDQGTVLATRKVATILMIPPSEMDRLIRDRDLFRAKLDDVRSRPAEQGKNVYRLDTETACYVKLQTFHEGNRIFGIVMDVSEEIIEKEKIRHERDHDLLTQLLGRRAFYSRLEELFASPDTLGRSAMMMFDLDGLKTINDTCGHAGGDKAIRMAASILSSIPREKKLAARLSGDEFAVFLYGAKDREELLACIDALHTEMMRGEVTVFERVVPVRLSGGYVLYPDYKKEYTELLRMADQALYVSKRGGKARFTEFEPSFAEEE